MNQCYKIVYSKIRQCFVVVSELTKSHGKGGRVSRVLCTVLLGACLAGVGQPVAWGAQATKASVNVTEDSSGDASSAWGIKTKAEGKASTAFGISSKASETSSTAFGELTTASGNQSTAFGWETTASGTSSTAFGFGTTASGTSSTAFGWETTAGWNQSTAFGKRTMAGGEASTAFGANTKAYGKQSTAFGHDTKAGQLYYIKDGKTIEADIERYIEKEDADEVTKYKVVYADGTESEGFASYEGAYNSNPNLITEGENASAWGQKTVASGDASTAFGYETTASGYVSTAFGWETTASGIEATAFGSLTTAGGQESTAFGEETIAGGVVSTAFGAGTKAYGKRSTAFGLDTKAGQLYYIKDGKAIEADIERYTVIEGEGEDEHDVTKYKVVYADGTKVEGFASYEEAYNSNPNLTTKGEDATAWGQKTVASGDASTAFGRLTTASEEYSTAFGYKTTASGETSTAFGEYTIATGKGSTAWGQGKSDNRTIAIGDSSTAFGVGSIAQGQNSLAALGGKTGEGNVAYVQETGLVIVNKTPESEEGKGSVAIGEGAEAKKDYTYAIGQNAKAQAANTIAIGNGAEATAENAISIGHGNKVSGKNSGAFGNNNTIEVNDGFVLGSNASVTAAGGVALGANSVVSTAAGEVGYDPSTGKASTETGETWKSTAAAVSVGGGSVDGKTITRQITGVAAGSADTDAVNVAQLKKVAEADIHVAKAEVTSGAPDEKGTIKQTVTLKDKKDNPLASFVVTDRNTTLVSSTEGLKLGDDNKLTLNVTDTDGKKVTGTVDLSRFAVDTDTTYKVEKVAGTGTTVNTYTLKASDNSATGETIVDTDTYVDGSSVTSTTDTSTGTTTHTVTLKDNTGADMTSFDVTDTNTYVADNAVSSVTDASTGTTTHTVKLKDNTGAEMTSFDVTDSNTYVADNTVSSVTDASTGTTTHTVTLKDNAGKEMTKFDVTDTNTQSTVQHADSSKEYLEVTSKDNSIGTKDYTVALTDKANTAIGNANTYLTSSGFSTKVKEGTGHVTGHVTVTSEGFKVGDNGPSMTVDGINAGGKKITNVADGKDAGDAVNYGQLQQVDQKITSQDDALKKLAHRDAQLERKIYRAGAHAAAIAALHPLDYDEDHKITAAAGIGQYHGSSALAVGAFYRPTENLMFSVGASLNENDSMVNAGLSYRFGTGSGNKTSPNNLHELKRQVSNLSEENRQLSAQLNSSEIKLAEESQKRASADAKILTLEEKIRRIEKMLKLK
jgi:autotransporter adhesin